MTDFKVIVHELEPITLVGGAFVDNATFDAAIKRAPKIVAADGGAAQVIAREMVPLAVIGDMDSLAPNDRARLPRDIIHKIPEQESTDFDKALRSIVAPLVLGIGFIGGRTDHQLAAFHTLSRHPDRRCMLIAEQDIVFLAPPELSLDLPPGTTVSLFPLGKVGGRSTGLRWPIDALSFAPDTKIGTSNLALGQVTLGFDAPRMLIILPRPVFSQAVEALLDAQQSWPAL